MSTTSTPINSSSIKIVYGQELRRLSMEKVRNFQDLISQIRQIFEFQQSKLFRLSYIDNENDNVSISSDIELINALDLFKGSGKVLRLIVTDNGSSSLSTQQQQQQQAPQPQVSTPIQSIPIQNQFQQPQQPTLLNSGFSLFDASSTPSTPIQQQQQQQQPQVQTTNQNAITLIPLTNALINAGITHSVPSSPMSVSEPQPQSQPQQQQVQQPTTREEKKKWREDKKCEKKAWKLEMKQQKHLKKQDKKAEKKNLKHSISNAMVSIQEENDISPRTAIQGGSQFVKTWRLKNDGLVAWPAGTSLVLEKGDRFGDLQIKFDRNVEINQEIEVKLNLTAPKENGVYFSKYRLHDNLGNVFGRPLKIKFRVSDPTSNAITNNNNSTIVDGEVAELLGKLHSMGFNEDSLNMKILEKSGRDFDKCVKKLTKKQFKQHHNKGEKKWKH